MRIFGVRVNFEFQPVRLERFAREFGGEHRFARIAHARSVR